jgi:predicted nucleic acid-binding protein
MVDRVVGTLVDSCVLLDVLAKDPVWFDWSSDALAAALNDAPLVINPIVYAETSVKYARIEDFQAVLDTLEVVYMPLSPSMAFLAGKCHVQYRERGGTAKSPLPDFFIGAHAALAKLRLLTRDPKRYRTYYPTVQVVAPTG